MIDCDLKTLNKQTKKYLASLITSFVFSILFFVLILPLDAKPVLSDPSSSAILTFQRKTYQQAKALLHPTRTAGSVSYQELKPKLKHYILYPYLEYYDLMHHISDIPLDRIQAFIDQYPDFPYHVHLKNHWLKTQADQSAWPQFLSGYHQIKPDLKNTELTCHYLQAQLSTAKNPTGLLKNQLATQITQLWLQGASQPKSCDPIFETWHASNPFFEEFVWQRIKLALKNNQTTLAHYLSQKLKLADQKIVDLWLSVHQHPKRILESKLFQIKHAMIPEIIVHGISKIAKTEPLAAIKIWQQTAPIYHFRDTHWGYIVREIGLSLAEKKHPAADPWLSKVPRAFTNSAVLEWRIRSSLLKRDWIAIHRIYEALPSHLAQKEEWRYWHARALEQSNQFKLAQRYLTELSHARSYYGFLASLRLSKPYTLKNKSLQVDPAEIESLKQRPGIQRAIELQQIGDLSHSQFEWQSVIRTLTESQKQAAAKLAEQYQLPNWTILALAKAEDNNDLNLRFPKVHANHILKMAKHYQIDPAWIFSITRQESAFIPTARSSKGALGLMQLLPSTARMVAKNIQCPLQTRRALFEPQKNITLGSAYLKMLLTQFNGNAILATAAYNGGPSRVKKWIPEHDMPCDIWIETIPYRQTREYVKNVMTYVIIYQALLGSQDSAHSFQKYLPRSIRKDT